MKHANLQNLIDINTLTQVDIERLIERANTLLNDVVLPKKTIDSCHGRLITPLFFEPSTRTLNSFVLAAKRLGALTLTPNLDQSAVCKGETLLDTIQTFLAMGTDVFVMRHQQNHIVEEISKKTKACFINAGDGTHQHPSQALLDVMTMQQTFADITPLSIAIVGDVAHSRVIGSLLPLLIRLGVNDIRLIGPDAFLPANIDSNIISKHNNLDALQDVHVVYMLRIQKERLHHNEQLDLVSYQKNYGLTQHHLDTLRDETIILHPGPINRDIEISSAVADAAQTRILDQVKNGIAMRMAILESLCLST